MGPQTVSRPSPVATERNAARLQHGCRARERVRTHAGYWNCEAQVAALVDELAGEPADALVLTGPVSSGKSRLLGAVVERLQALPRPPFVVRIDCRAGDFSSPEAFARALQNRALEAQQGNKPVLRSLAQLLPLVNMKASVGGLDFSFALQRLLQEAVPMEDMLPIYQRAIDSSKAEPPIFIVVRFGPGKRSFSAARRAYAACACAAG